MFSGDRVNYLDCRSCPNKNISILRFLEQCVLLAAVGQAIRMGDHGSVTKPAEKNLIVVGCLAEKKMTLNIKASNSLSAITLRRHK